MKTRNDFVTNSSSSSFIIAMNENMMYPNVKRLYDIILLSDGISTEKARLINDDILTGAEELDGGDTLKEAKELINNNWKIYYKSIDRDNIDLIGILSNICEDSKNFQYIKCLYSNCE